MQTNGVGEIFLRHDSTSALGLGGLGRRDMRGKTIEQDGLSLEVRHEPFDAALSANTGLFETTERNGEVEAQTVVSNGTAAKSSCDGIGTLHVVGEHGRVQSIRTVIG